MARKQPSAEDLLKSLKALSEAEKERFFMGLGKDNELRLWVNQIPHVQWYMDWTEKLGGVVFKTNRELIRITTHKRWAERDAQVLRLHKDGKKPAEIVKEITKNPDWKYTERGSLFGTRNVKSILQQARKKARRIEGV
jgi:hypothetical protein